MPLPAARPLAQSGFADHFLTVQQEQHQAVVKIRVPEPFAEHGPLKNGALDEQPLLLGHGHPKFVQADFIRPAQRAQDGGGAVAQFQGGGEIFQNVFERDGRIINEWFFVRIF
jgi:hypothetical protein